MHMALVVNRAFVPTALIKHQIMKSKAASLD